MREDDPSTPWDITEQHLWRGIFHQQFHGSSSIGSLEIPPSCVIFIMILGQFFIPLNYGNLAIIVPSNLGYFVGVHDSYTLW